MANILGLALKVTGDASGLPASLTPVDRALANLAKQAERATAAFNPLTQASVGAVRAQEQFAERFARLAEQLQQNVIGPQEYAAAFGQLTEEAKQSAVAFERGIEITKQYTTAEERRAQQLQEIADLLQQEAITEETAARARAQLTGANEAAAAAEKQLAADKQAAARIIEANLTAVERAQRQYDAAVAEAQRLEQAGLLTKKELNTEIDRQSKILARVSAEANKAADAAGKPTLQFNELSGILSVLPGPIGNLAGRLSGLASAGEGLSRVFGGNVRASLSGFAASIAQVINPATLVAGALAGIGAAASRVATGLVALEDRVEKLGNTADKLGVSFGFIQTLEEAARRSGTSIDSVSAAFGRLQRNVTGIDEESKTAQNALANLGLTAEQVQRLKPEEQYLLIGQRLAGIEDPARRTATAINLFGRAGADLLPFFRNLGGAATDLRDIGGSLSDDQRRQIDAFGNALDRLAVSAQGAGQQLKSTFADAGTAVANATADAVGGVAEFLKEQNRLNRVSTEIQRLKQLLVTRAPTDEQLAAIRAGQTAEEVYARVLGKAVELRQELEEPISSALAKTFADTAASVEKAKDEAIKLGQEGFAAVLQYENAITQLRDRLDAGLFNEETFRREAAKAGVAFKEELAKIEGDAKLDIQINADAQKTLADLQDQINKAADDAAKFGKSGFDAAERFQSSLSKLGDQFRKNQINATTLANKVAEATAEYDKQVAGLRQAAELQKQLIQQQRDRVNELLREKEVRTQLEADIRTVLIEQLRLEEEIQLRRREGAVFAANAAVARLAQLDQLRAKLEEQQQAAEQGFADGFAKAFEGVNNGIQQLIAKAGEFGKAGAAGAELLRAGVQRAQEQVAAGILNAEGFRLEVAQQQELFDRRLAAAKRVEDFLRQGIDARRQAEIDAANQLEERKKQAAENVAAIQAKIDEQQRQLQENREKGNLKAARQDATRLKQLQALQRNEQKIADGTGKRSQAAIAQAQQGMTNFDRMAASAYGQQIQALNNAVTQSIGGVTNALAASADSFRKLMREQRASLMLGPQQIAVSDVRTAEGQQMILDAAAQYQDPALIQMRKSNQLLGQIAQGLTQNLSRIGVPAAI